MGYCNLYSSLRIILNRKSALERICLKEYSKAGTIEDEYIIASETYDPVDVTPVEGTLENRWDYSYKTITSKKLKKIDREKMKKGSAKSESIDSRLKALTVLKKWYDEVDENILTEKPTTSIQDFIEMLRKEFKDFFF